MKHTSAFLVALVGLGHTHAADPIPPEGLGKLQALIRPSKGEEPWADIPWRTDLWQARKLAAEQGKPILLWEMDGHPLGCT